MVENKYTLPGIVFHQGDIGSSSVLGQVDWQWSLDIIRYNTIDQGTLFPWGTATYQGTEYQQVDKVVKTWDNKLQIQNSANLRPVSGWKLYNTANTSIRCTEDVAKQHIITVALPGPYFAQALAGLDKSVDSWTVLFVGSNNDGTTYYTLNPPSENAPLWLVPISLYHWQQFVKAYSITYTYTTDQAYAAPPYSVVSLKNQAASYKKLGTPFDPLFSNGRYKSGVGFSADTMRLVVKSNKKTFCLGNPGLMQGCPTTMQEVCSSPSLLWDRSQVEFAKMSGPANRALAFAQQNCAVFNNHQKAPQQLIGCPDFWRTETQTQGGNNYTSCTIDGHSCSGVKMYEDDWWDCNKGGICNAQQLAEWMKQCDTYSWKTPVANAIGQYAKKSL